MKSIAATVPGRLRPIDPGRQRVAGLAGADALGQGVLGERVALHASVRSRADGPTRLGRRATASVVAAALVVPLLAGCSLGDKKAMATLIIHSAKKVEAARTAEAGYSYTLEITKTTASIPSNGRRASGPLVPLSIDFGSHKSLVSVLAPSSPPGATGQGSAGNGQSGQGQGSAAAAAAAAARSGGAAGGGGAEGGVASQQPAIVFDGYTIYAHKIGATAQRSWVKLDFSGLDRKDSSKLSLGQFLSPPINPWLGVQLLAGTLAGSVRKIGREQVGSVSTTHYKMNVDFAKAVNRFSDHEKESVVKVMKANQFAGTVFPAQVWLDDHGFPRRMAVRFRQQLDRLDQYGFTMTIELTKLGAPVQIKLPTSDETAEVSNLPQFISTFRAA